MFCFVVFSLFFFFFKQKTAYEMRISDWSSDVCSSDLLDDLKQAWQSLDRQLQQQKRINLQLLTESHMRKAKAGLRWLQAFSVAQIAIGAVVTVFCARFWIAHMHEPALLLSGIVLHVYGIAMIISGVDRKSTRLNS